MSGARTKLRKKNKNNRLFNEEDNESITGTFNINTWAIKEPKDLGLKIVIKTEDRYIVIHLEKTPVLEVTQIEKGYKYNTDLKDNNDNSIFLKRTYYNDNFLKKYNNKLFNFANQYSKDYILQNYPTLKITKIINEQTAVEPTIEQQNEERKENDFTLLKKRLFCQYL